MNLIYDADANGGKDGQECDEVLKKIYYKNAIRIIPGIDKSQFMD